MYFHYPQTETGVFQIWRDSDLKYIIFDDICGKITKEVPHNSIAWYSDILWNKNIFQCPTYPRIPYINWSLISQQIRRQIWTYHHFGNSIWWKWYLCFPPKQVIKPLNTSWLNLAEIITPNYSANDRLHSISQQPQKIYHCENDINTMIGNLRSLMLRYSAEKVSIDDPPVFMFLYITHILIIIFPLKCFIFSEITFCILSNLHCHILET